MIATTLAGVAIGLSNSPAFADNTTDVFALAPEQIFDAQVISASRTSETVWESPAAIFALSSFDIENSGATSVPEALRLVPGVDVAQINTSGWAVSVRGFNSALANKLLVLIDGRESYDPLFSGVYWDVQETPLQDIDRIEVVRGPGASLWGANAVNGVINIITKPASETQGLFLSVSAGGNERAEVTARLGGVLGANANWRVYAEGFNRDSQTTLAGEDDNSAWQSRRGGFRFDASPDNENQFTLQGDVYHSETGQLRVVPSLSPPFETLDQERIAAEGANMMAHWTRGAEGEGRLTVQTYVDFTRRRQALLEDARTTFDLDVQYEFPSFASHSVVAGARYRDSNDDVDQTEAITSPDDAHRTQLLSAFIQDQIAISPAWRLTLGSKFDDSDYTGLETQPSLRLQWLGSDQTAWTAISRAVRLPSDLERQYDILFAAGPPLAPLAVPTTIELLPSPDFTSEVVTAYELGYRRQWSPNLSMDVALFHNVYHGLSTLSPQPFEFGVNPPRLILAPILITNSTSAHTDGMEVAFDWRVRDDVNVSMSYSFLDMDLNGPPAPLAIDSEAAEGQSPRNQANLRVRWSVSERLTADATVNYVDRLPAYDIDAYTRLDLRLAWTISTHAQLEIVGQNLLDNQHREFGAPTDVNAAEIGRNIFGRLRWRG